jgi:hypothetical protein
VHCPRLVTLRDSEVRHKTPLFSVSCMFVDHVTRLGVSRLKEIWLEICSSLHIDNRICFELSTFFWIARGCVDGVSLHDLLRSEAEFWHHLPIVLWIHNLPAGMCIWRTAERCCRNSVSDQSRPWRLTPSTRPRVGLGPILTY